MSGVTVTSESKATVDECRVPTTTIELSTLDNIKGVIESLFEEHYEEIARNKKVMVLKRAVVKLVKRAAILHQGFQKLQPQTP